MEEGNQVSIILDTPEQISAWVLLSRRSQVQMHLKGYKVKGILSALKRDFGDHGSRVANYVLPIEEAAAAAGIRNDWKLVNLHVMVGAGHNYYTDEGIYNSDTEAMDAIEGLAGMVANGIAVVVLTLDACREPNGGGYTMED